MATFSACTSSSSIAPAPVALLQKPSAVKPFAILGLPSVTKNVGRVKCSMEGKPQEGDSKLGIGASSVIAVACAAAMSSPSAIALVDERMSTEGTGLPFGLSNNLLGWLLLGMFALIWSLYFVYTASLEEDEESGLSL